MMEQRRKLEEALSDTTAKSGQKKFEQLQKRVHMEAKNGKREIQGLSKHYTHSLWR